MERPQLRNTCDLLFSNACNSACSKFNEGHSLCLTAWDLMFSLEQMTEACMRRISSGLAGTCRSRPARAPPTSTFMSRTRLPTPPKSRSGLPGNVGGEGKGRVKEEGAGKQLKEKRPSTELDNPEYPDPVIGAFRHTKPKGRSQDGST